MKDYDPTGKSGPKKQLPDVIKIIEPKEEDPIVDKPVVGTDAEPIDVMA